MLKTAITIVPPEMIAVPFWLLALIPEMKMMQVMMHYHHVGESESKAPAPKNSTMLRIKP
jgi:hypothetical protein